MARMVARDLAFMDIENKWKAKQTFLAKKTKLNA